MTINLLKMSVGVESIKQLEQKQIQKLSDAVNRNEKPEIIHITRNTPRRTNEVLQGGSIYWVIKRFVLVRQKVKDVRQIEVKNGKKKCAIILHPDLIKTEIKKIRPFQGWRYLSEQDAPKDLPKTLLSNNNLPIELINELRHLGLL